MALHIKIFIKPDDVSSIPRTLMVEERADLQRVLHHPYSESVHIAAHSHKYTLKGNAKNA